MACAAWAPAAGSLYRRISARGARAVGASSEGRGHGAVAWGGDGQAARDRERCDSGSKTFRERRNRCGYGRAFAHRRRLDERIELAEKRAPAERDFVYRRRDDWAGRRSFSGRISQATWTNWRHPDKAGRRCARRRGAFHWESDRSAGEVRGTRRKIRRAGRILSG